MVLLIKENNDMKELIKIALDIIHEELQNKLPKTKKTKKKLKSINISSIDPLELGEFIENNEIPDNAYFSVSDCDGGIMSYNEPCLDWYIDIPTTEEDKLKYYKDRFNKTAWHSVRPILLDNGYKRTHFNSVKFREFKNTSIVEMYTNKDFDKLEQYYSLYFKKED